MGKDYYVGVDAGTGSLGWSVTNEKYEIQRSHGKALWGVRLFDAAETAEERRGFRTNRRRLDRRNWRLELLQEIFAEEINQVDDGFFLRMKESRYLPEDKRGKDGNCPELPYAIFADHDYTDKNYHKQFPTIYHLRKWLMETSDTPDIRLVYLAMHHLVKHRGHFLFSGNIDEIREFHTAFDAFLDLVRGEELGFERTFDENCYQETERILQDEHLTRSVKKSQLVKCLDAGTAAEKELIGAISGCTVKLSSIFADGELDACARPKFSFSDISYDEYAGELQEILGEQYVIIESAKAVYDWAILADVLGSYRSISEAKTALYEKHKKDLRYLKKLVKKHLSAEAYKEIFVLSSEKKSNYPAYIGMTKKNGRKVPIQGKQCSQGELYAYLKKSVIDQIADKNAAQYLRDEMEHGTFLPKLVSKENSVIPYQIHLYELNRILENLQDRISLLKQEGEHIRQIFAFRIPYYVGPLNGVRKDGKETNWVCRRQEGKIYPWNFSEIIDTEASAERFIRRMTNKCTYLPAEDVLPKNSLLYGKFMVLDELNNLCLNGEPISVELKQAIYQDVFKRYRKVTQKKLFAYLIREGIAGKETDITGIDGDFKSSLTAYHDFKEKLSGIELSPSEKETIILNITLFGEDKKLLQKRLEKLFPDMTEKQRIAVSNLSYKGWGRLSEKFLEGITAPDPETGEVWTIIRTMWETNDNLMQVLSSKYQFAEAIERENDADEKKEISHRLIENLMVSPAVRRQIWQMLLVLKELCKVQGAPPKRIFIEMAREKADSGRTRSRKKMLIDLYKKCKSEERDWINELEQTDDSRLRSDRLYLYYTQNGRCMYSGDPIELKDLWDNTKYDIDHIYPQSKVMDDSLDNRVLVKRVYNGEKEDRYPIEKSIRDARHGFWKSLLDKGFISREKYKRLTRTTEFEEAELTGFIARQLVETRQGTKAAASILKQVFPDTDIVYVKASVVSRFRQDFKFIKVREMNDLHHAKDAYLNIVVGNTYFVKFTKDAGWFVRKNPGRTYNLKKMFLSGKVERNGETAWISGDCGTIGTVRRFMAKNNIIVTRRPYEVTGGFYDQMLMKKGKGQIPIKTGDIRLQDIAKYGGYNKETGAYFVLAESDGKKDTRIRTIEYVPVRLKKELGDEKKLCSYLEQRGLKNPKILLKKIKIDTLFRVDGFYMWLSGRTGNQLIFKGANQLILSQEDSAVLKKIQKFITRRKQDKSVQIYDTDGLSEENLSHLYDTFLEKLRTTVYAKRLGTQEKTLSEKKKDFLALGKEDKCIVLNEILHLFQCQSGSANLKLIGGPGSAGILVLNSDITKCQDICIINQSPAGIYEQIVDLKAL